jgi:hypothetical protein
MDPLRRGPRGMQAFEQVGGEILDPLPELLPGRLSDAAVGQHEPDARCAAGRWG